jgi:hypothetical protein
MEFFSQWLLAGVLISAALLLLDDVLDRMARRRERKREER